MRLPGSVRYLCVYVRACACMRAPPRVCVSVYEREREGERETDRQTDRKRLRYEGECMYVFLWMCRRR